MNMDGNDLLKFEVLPSRCCETDGKGVFDIELEEITLFSEEARMIPKKIHYIWFGRGEKTALVKKCISSWKRVLGNYEIIEWNEDNFNVSENIYLKQAYDNKMYAFASDYARLKVLYEYGGIYLDTDVEILKPLDVFLDESFFTGFESKDCPITAVMGCEKGNKVVKDLYEQYSKRVFKFDNGALDLLTNTRVITNYMFQKGFKPNGRYQSKDGITIYPQVFFCPNNFLRVFEIPSRSSYSIHHFEGDWDIKKHQLPIYLRSGIIFRIRRYVVGVGRNLIGTERLIAMKERK